MPTALVLLTRDLRVHDQPALAAACAHAERIAVLFVLDEAILGSPAAAPNRLAFLLEALADVDTSLRDRGGRLVVRRGDLAREVAGVVRETGATSLHLAADVSAFARARERRLAILADDLRLDLRVHPGPSVVPPEALTTTDGGAYRVFTPYWRRWAEHLHRAPLPAPERVPAVARLDPGRLPTLAELTTGPTSPGRAPGGEGAGRRRLDEWLAGGIDGYEDGRDRLADDATSRLSPYLRFGCVSAVEVVDRLDRRRRGHDAFLRQLCWRDFNQQLLAAHPDLPRTDLRGGERTWHDDPEGLAAWVEGRTGYPVVDAGMRHLREEGWMHNRARMLTASLLTKHLLIDWRLGARHFMDWLVDGEVANNVAQWQWVAGTGTDTRPGRMLNPVAQGRRHDPDGRYVRRHVPELAHLDDAVLHTPWEADGSLLAPGGYPPPLVDHDEARERFLAVRRGPGGR